MSEYTHHDLRRKAQRITDLTRRHRANIPLTPDELEELERGVDEKEMWLIIDSIRGARRSATESKKTKAVEKKRVEAEPFDLHDFLDEEIDIFNV